MGRLFDAVREAFTDVRNESPVPLAGHGSGMLQASTTSRPNMAAQQLAYGTSSTLFAIVDRLATSQAQINWRLFRKRTDGRRTYAPEHRDDRDEVIRHPALSVWDRPNPFYSQSDFIEAIQQHFELTGEWMIAAARAGAGRGVPLELWAVRPDRVTPVTDPSKFLVGWMYHGPGGQVPLELEQVIQTKRSNPLDPFRGLSPVGSLLLELHGERSAAAYNAKFFENGARPGGLIRPDRELTDAQFKTLLSRWRESHGGVSNAHRVGVLTYGDWVDLKVTQKDMEFAELRRFSQEVIRRAFGFPKPLLGDVDDVNRANADAAGDMFSKWLVVPRARRMRDMLNRKFLPMFGAAGQGVEFDFDDPTPPNIVEDRADRDAAVERAEKLIGMGVDPAEAFEHEGLPPFTMIERPVTVTPPTPREPAPAAEPDAVFARRVEDSYIARVLADVPTLTLPAGTVVGQDAPPAAPSTEDLDGAPATVDPDKLAELAPVGASHAATLTALLAEWEAILAEQYDTLAAQVAAAIDADDAEELADLDVPVAAALLLLHRRMRELARDAAEQVAAEAAGQDVTIAAGTPDDDDLHATATVATAVLAAQLRASAAREALQQRAPDRTGTDVASRVRDHLESLTSAQPRFVLGAALTYAQGVGRAATYRAAARLGIEAAYYADEVLDSRQCARCREVHGMWLGNTIGQALTWYPNGWYLFCLGGMRCRGQIIALWRIGVLWPADPDASAARNGHKTRHPAALGKLEGVRS